MAEKTCGNCKHAHGWTMTKHTPPKINTRHAAACCYEFPTVAWPISVFPALRRMPTPSYVQSDYTDCPCWEGK